jgi:hypothetical protein
MSQGVSTYSSLTEQEVDRIFKKQAQYEQEQEESIEKLISDRQRSDFFAKKSLHLLSNSPVMEQKQWMETRKTALAGARLEACRIQKDLKLEPRREYLENLKQGVLAGIIQIHETPTGFQVDTPEEQVDEFVMHHLAVTGRLPTSSDLAEGKFLMGALTEHDRERVSNVRKNLMEEFHAESPSELMLVDVAVSSYFRAMYATRMEMQSLHQATDYPMEMFEIMAKSVQPYIHACQNCLERTLKALRSCRRDSTLPTGITVRHSSKTEVNVRVWGHPLKLALHEITKTKERSIHLNEIKETMTKYATGLDTASLPNADIAYVLQSLGLRDKTHTLDGNRYNITREQANALMKS